MCPINKNKVSFMPVKLANLLVLRELNPLDIHSFIKSDGWLAMKIPPLL